MTTQANWYDEYFKKLVQRIGFLQGALYHVNIDLKSYQKYFVENIGELKELNHRLGTKLVISDISGPTDNGWPFVYPTDGKYMVTVNEYENYTQDLIFEFSAFVLLQAYEAFTIFLKSILASYFSKNNTLADRLRIIRSNESRIVIWFKETFLFRKRKNKQNHDFAFFINNMYCGTNNNNLFKCLRKISEHYHQFEKNNNRKINLIDFYKVFAISRHSITHNASIITTKTIKTFNKEQLKILDYFTSTETINNSRKIILTQDKLSELLVIISEHAFLIYKSVSLESGLNWKILKNMQ